MSNASPPRRKHHIVPLLVIVLAFSAIGISLIQEVAAQDARTLKPPFRLIQADKSARALDGLLPPLDAPIIISQTFNSSYQPASDPAQVGWHQLVGSGAVNGYTWARTAGNPISNTVWSAQLAPLGGVTLDPVTDTYTNGMEALLVYGPIDLSDYHTAILSATYWLDTPIPPTADGDYYGVAVSTDGSIFKSVTAEKNADASLSTPHTTIYNLSDSAGRQPVVWIGVYFTSDDNNINRRGAFVQQVVLRGVPFNKTYMPVVSKNYPPTPTPTPQVYTYEWTYGSGASNDVDFAAWGGYKSTDCGSGNYIQNITTQGQSGGAMVLNITCVGTNTSGVLGGTSPNVLTGVNFEYSADILVVNGQKDARFGLIFDASSSTFGSNPPFDPNRNYYKLKLEIDGTNRGSVPRYQLQQCTNGNVCAALFSEQPLPSVNAGAWYTFKIRQEGTALTFYLGNTALYTTGYDPAWGNDRRKFGLYVEARASNNEGGPFEIRFDNVRVKNLP